MDWQRNLLIAGIIAVLAILFVRWNEFKDDRSSLQESFVKEAVVVPDATVAPEASGDTTEAIPDPSTATDANEPITGTSSSSRLISVVTDVLEVTIDTYGGDIVRIGLPEHLSALSEKSDPFILLNRTSSQTYIAQSGLVGANGTDTREGRPLFHADATDYHLEHGSDLLEVDLKLTQGDVSIIKRFSFRRGDYLMGVDYLIDNKGPDTWSASLFGQIQRNTFLPDVKKGMGMQPYVGAALTTPEENYKKVKFSDLDEKPFRIEKMGGWVSMVQHYFISAWVPDQQLLNKFNLRKLGNRDLYVLGFTSPVLQVPAGEIGKTGASFYAGPKDQYRLEKISPYLDLTVDYGWLWWVAKPIFYTLTLIHDLVGNWGWSIILLTILIKALFFKLSATSYRSMAKMRKLQPEMARLKDLYGDDRQKLSQEMMNFYKKEKVNPMGGCLPMLIQMPVFIALYWVLFESVELRHAPWILWIKDLSVQDPYFVLPVLNGISMFLSTLLQPVPPDPTQAKVMKIMPVAFSFLFAFFPAGLVIYWTVNSVLSILQQWIITRRIEAGSG